MSDSAFSLRDSVFSLRDSAFSMLDSAFSLRDSAFSIVVGDRSFEADGLVSARLLSSTASR